MYFKSSKKLFFFNSITGAAQLVLTSLLVFICIPIFIKYLGKDVYGAFGAITVIGNLSAFANLSLDATLIKYISEQGKSEESDYDILVALLLLFLALIPLTIVLFIFKDFFLLEILKIPSIYIQPSRVLLECLLISNFFLLFGRIFTSILDVNHKIYLTSFYTFVYSTVYWGGIIYVVSNGYGLESVGYVALLAAFLWFVLVFYSSMKVWGKISTIGLMSNFTRIVKKQLKYSMKIYTGACLSFLYEPLTKILISNLLGLSYVAIYDVTLRVKGNLMALYQKLLYPIQPLIAQEADYNKLRDIIQKISRSIFYSLVPVIVFLILCTRPIIELWIKELDVVLVTISTVAITSFSLLLVITVVPIYIFLRLKDHPEKEIYLQGMNVIVNLFVIFAFFKLVGYYAIVLGSVASLLMPFIMSLYYQKKYLNISIFYGLQDFFKYVSVFLFIGVLVYLFTLVFNEVTWFNVCLTFLFSFGLSFYVFLRTKVLTKKAIFFWKK